MAPLSFPFFYLSVFLIDTIHPLTNLGGISKQVIVTNIWQLETPKRKATEDTGSCLSQSLVPSAVVHRWVKTHFFSKIFWNYGNKSLGPIVHHSDLYLSSFLNKSAWSERGQTRRRREWLFLLLPKSASLRLYLRVRKKSPDQKGLASASLQEI